jgi:hypothetical protein
MRLVWTLKKVAGCAALGCMLLASCGVSADRGDAGSEPDSAPSSERTCPPTPVWRRLVSPRHQFERAVSPEAAVQEFASGIDLRAEITSVGETSPAQEVEVEVVDSDTDRGGIYQVVLVNGAWSVSGGDGCGAPGPVEGACPTPSNPSSQTFQVSCDGPQPDDD